jgi:hypothetical protein
MQKPTQIDQACKLIIWPLLVTVALDIFELATQQIYWMPTLIAWVIYLLIALIPYNLNKQKRGARIWFCIYFAITVLATLLLLFEPTVLKSVSALRLAITVIQVLIETYVLALLFSAPVSLWLAKQNQLNCL